MKKINLAASLLLLSMAAWAQRGEPVNHQKDQQIYQGYTISLLPAMSGTYGYKIVKGKELIAIQMRNPFTGAPDGLNRKEDAFKTAQWQIRQLVAGKTGKQGISLTQDMHLPAPLLQQLQGSHGPRINQRIPGKVAKELQIDSKN